MNIKKISLLLCCTALIYACKKNVHDTSFEVESRVFFMHNKETDSLVHSFANYPAAEYKDLNLTFQIMGNVATHDRIAYVEVDRAGTTALDTEYEVADQVVVPAGSVKATLSVKVKNTSRLQVESTVLKLKLRPSEDFIIEPIKKGKMDELVEFRLIWTDILLKPADWPATWGGYSQTKHRLVIDLSGESEYSGTEWSTSGLLYSIMGTCNEWLADYKQAHAGEVYRDENGKEIRFCPTCN